MLPFLKNKEGGGLGESDDEPIERKHDDDYDMLDAVAQDILAAIERKDAKLLKEALSGLCQHIAEQDQEQDQPMPEA